MRLKGLRQQTMCVLLELSLFLFLPWGGVAQCPATFSEVEHWCYNVEHYNPGYITGAQDGCSSLIHGGKLVDLETRDEFLAIVNWMKTSESR